MKDLYGSFPNLKYFGPVTPLGGGARATLLRGPSPKITLLNIEKLAYLRHLLFQEACAPHKNDLAWICSYLYLIISIYKILTPGDLLTLRASCHQGPSHQNSQVQNGPTSGSSQYTVNTIHFHALMHRSTYIHIL